MSILSGLATAPGVSALLNAPRDSNAQLRASVGEPATKADLKRPDAGSRVQSAETVRPVLQAARGETSAAVSKVVDSRDSRFRQFMKALEALRFGPGDSRADKSRRAELAAEAPMAFGLFDGRPTPVEPVAGPEDGAADVAAEEPDKAA